ncbi:PIN/TRAM domain-containing protein [Sporolactobacillus shoreicorticis]|uniref:PIN/TRAM domain-containing protein n=1 Tax=Sporolactobacillus shoreicorticis TaxID=1923877 RepID=A0ABW5S8Y4_9BACL|nr:PIN/TRAM domain-containing protein [Sporolactobacillus shoreicorticis]MCO7127476.1 PIN/TRAM domain-containing protein [Sporolactobacillus shoreicorticis]
MIKRVIQLFFILIGGTLGFVYIPKVMLLLNLGNGVPGWISSPFVGMVIGAVVMAFLSFWFVDSLVNIMKGFEDRIIKAPVTDVLFGTVGLGFGLAIAFLIQLPFTRMPVPGLSTILPIFLYIFLGYFFFQVGFKKRDELISLFRLPSRSKDRKKEAQVSQATDYIPYKIFDTSVIIDGRIADICQTRFLEGTMVIPHFVLEELQHIADSSDVLKRNRGRRGLDILNKIQKDHSIHVDLYEGDYDDITEVDSKLVRLAKEIGGIVVTNDFNLNKVCEFQKVPVLNINDLANAVKPVVLPGEELRVQVIKDGKEQNQGIGYLDDGTMIVVEEGHRYIGKTIDVVITSVLQTSAGRMIFAKPKLLEKAL